VRSNDVRGVGLQGGIYIESGTGTDVRDNRIRDFDTGIWVDASGTTLRRNDARGNVSAGCIDTTEGDGTSGTANTWDGNHGTPGSTPAEICPAA